MQTSLGPRSLIYIGSDGSRGTISLLIRAEPDQTTQIGGGDTANDEVASIQISAPWFDRTITLSADDEIQLIFRLSRAADIYTQKICRENNYKIYKYFPGDVKGDFGIYQERQPECRGLKSPRPCVSPWPHYIPGRSAALLHEAVGLGPPFRG